MEETKNENRKSQKYQKQWENMESVPKKEKTVYGVNNLWKR